MKKKLRLAVLMGGKSPEYEISLISGKEVVRNLSPQKYDVIPIIISRDCTSFQLNNKKYLFSQLSAINCQLFFIAMHGPYGEDGTVQGLLELLGINYTGSGVLASAIGMDKLYSRKLFIQVGLNVPKYIVLEKGENQRKVGKILNPPVFVHPNNQGSAIGASLVKKEEDLEKALKTAFSYSDVILVDEFIKGTEVTCAILGNNNPFALPLVEIRSKHEFFDYESKYNPSLADEICPAEIGKTLTKKAQKTAISAYKAIGCRGFGRVDMIIKDKKIYVLEVNTTTGLTPVSLFPKAAHAAGISYPQLLDKIIHYSLQN